MTTPEDLRIAAQLQNHAIELADVRLESAKLPTYTEVVTQLADLLTWIGNAPDLPPATVAAAHALIDRASGCKQ